MEKKHSSKSRTSIDISVSTLGPGTKELINQGDFHAEGDSILLLNGVSPNLVKITISQATSGNKHKQGINFWRGSSKS